MSSQPSFRGAPHDGVGWNPTDRRQREDMPIIAILFASGTCASRLRTLRAAFRVFPADKGLISPGVRLAWGLLPVSSYRALLPSGSGLLGARYLAHGRAGRDLDSSIPAAPPVREPGRARGLPRARARASVHVSAMSHARRLPVMKPARGTGSRRGFSSCAHAVEDTGATKKGCAPAFID